MACRLPSVLATLTPRMGSGKVPRNSCLTCREAKSYRLGETTKRRCLVQVASTSKTYFTKDIGATTGAYLAGPLILTFIEPHTTVQVFDGHHVQEIMILELNGDNFAGGFYVRYDWCIKGVDPKVVCSGFYPYPAVPLKENVPHELPGGGTLIYSLGVETILRVPIAGVPTQNVELLKEAALQEAEDIMQCRLVCDDQGWYLDNGQAVLHVWPSPEDESI